MKNNIWIIDNVLPDFEDYMKRLKFARFSDVVSQGQKYSDISQDMSAEGLYSAVEKEMGFKPENVINFLRAYRDRPEYRHPMWIHSDTLFSDYIGIFFAQPSQFIQDDGVSLWKNLELNDIELNTKDHTGGTLDKCRIVHVIFFNKGKE